MILLDTHVLVWLASSPERLSEPAHRAIEANATALHVSVVTAWEIALLARRGRLDLPMPAAEYLSRALSHHGVNEIELCRDVAVSAVGLPDIHNDPFDRVLVAECLLRGMPLISSDRTIARYPGIEVIW